MSGLFKFILLPLLFLCLGLSIGEKVIEVKVDKRVVETGEIFTYQIDIQSELDTATLKLPEFKNFSIVSQSQSRNYTSKAGVKKVIINFTYLLFAPEPGKFTIEAVSLESETESHQSREITITVTGESLEKKRKILPYIEKGTNL